MSELPSGWGRAEIGDLCNLINGRAFKPQEWSEFGLPIIRIQNLNNPDAKFNHFSGTFDAKHHVKNGDLLFAWSGTPGTSFGAHIWHGADAVLNQHIFKIEFSELVINRGFLLYAINQKLDELIGSAQGGVGLRHVTKGTFEKTEIVFPPLAEQTRIAAKLDELLAQVDTLKARVDGIPALLKRFRQSVLAAAVSGRLTEEWREHSTAVSQASKAPLGELITEMRNGLSAKPNEVGRGLPILRISSVRVGSVDQTDIRFLECSEADKNRYSLKEGDLLFTRYNGSLELVGVCGLLRQLSHVILVYPDKLIRVRCNTEIVRQDYLEIFFSAPSTRQRVMDLVKSTSGQKGISGQDLKKIVVTYPHLTEQTEIVRRVEQLFAFADQLEAKIASAKSRIDHLTQSILAKAFRGELVPQDPNDEPASVLLERIKALRTAAPKAKRGRKASV